MITWENKRAYSWDWGCAVSALSTISHSSETLLFPIFHPFFWRQLNKTPVLPRAHTHLTDSLVPDYPNLSPNMHVANRLSISDPSPTIYLSVCGMCPFLHLPWLCTVHDKCTMWHLQCFPSFKAPKSLFLVSSLVNHSFFFFFLHTSLVLRKNRQDPRLRLLLHVASVSTRLSGLLRKHGTWLERPDRPHSWVIMPQLSMSTVVLQDHSPSSISLRSQVHYRGKEVTSRKHAQCLCQCCDVLGGGLRCKHSDLRGSWEWRVLYQVQIIHNTLSLLFFYFYSSYCNQFSQCKHWSPVLE